MVRSYGPHTGNLLWQVDIGNGGLNATPTAIRSSNTLCAIGRERWRGISTRLHAWFGVRMLAVFCRGTRTDRIGF